MSQAGSGGTPAEPGPFAPYRPRTIGFLGLAHRGPWTLKVYRLERVPGVLPPALVEAAQDLALDFLELPMPQPRSGATDWAGLPTHGLGFLLVHSGLDGVFIVLDVWIGENMLRQQVWVTTLAPPWRFDSLRESGLAMCVWELQVIQHEREAWLRHVLTPSGRHDLPAYLADVLPAIQPPPLTLESP